MSAGARQGTGDTFSGALYRTTGSPFNQSFSSSTTKVTQVGTMTISFSGPNSGTLSYSLNGVSVTKNIEKQVFSTTGSAQCVPSTSGRASATNYTDLWWNAPANSESGWGVNITHQGDTIFLTWFTYDDNGNPLWLVASAMAKTGQGVYVGTLYRTTGPAFNAAWDPSRVTATAVGFASLSFSDASNGTFSYSVNGVSGSKPITRQLFATPKTTCS